MTNDRLPLFARKVGNFNSVKVYGSIIEFTEILEFLPFAR